MKATLTTIALLDAALTVAAPVLAVPLVPASSQQPPPTAGTTCSPAEATAEASTASRDCPSGDLSPVLAFARAQLGKPYIFGAAGPNAYDCSSLVQAAYRTIAITLPRLAEDQANSGTPIAVSPTEVRPGDLIVSWGGTPPHDHGHIAVALKAAEEIQAPHTGDVVKITPIGYARVQTIRRIATPTTPISAEVRS